MFDIEIECSFRLAHNECNTDISSLKNQIKSLESQENKLIDKCFSQINDLTGKCQANQNEIQKLFECYTKTQKYPIFMHQMSLDQYYDECDLFNQYVETYMANNFKINVSSHEFITCSDILKF